MSDPLAGARKVVAPKMVRKTVVMVPEGYHCMLPPELAHIVGALRFVRVEEDGSVRPLPLSTVATSTIPVDETMLEELDRQYYSKFQGG